MPPGVLLRRDGHTQLVYKHAISTVMPGAPIQLFDASKIEAAAQNPLEAVFLSCAGFQVKNLERRGVHGWLNNLPDLIPFGTEHRS